MILCRCTNYRYRKSFCDSKQIWIFHFDVDSDLLFVFCTQSKTVKPLLHIFQKLSDYFLQIEVHYSSTQTDDLIEQAVVQSIIEELYPAMKWRRMLRAGATVGQPSATWRLTSICSPALTTPARASSTDTGSAPARTRQPFSLNRSSRYQKALT